MKTWQSTSSWLGRALPLACIIVLPFAGFLVSNRYPATRPESAAALLALTLTAAILAAVCRKTLFYAVALVCASAISVVPLQRMLAPALTFSVPVLALGVALSLGGLMFFLRQYFFRVVMIFAAAAFTAHVFQPLLAGARGTESSSGTARPAHILYLVLDEHMGPAGLPSYIPECRAAAKSIAETFQTNGFRLYPYAYSNFSSTLESLPSVMNRRLPHLRGTSMRPGSPDVFGVQSVDVSRFFAGFRARGYDVSVFQFRGIDFASGEHARLVEYSPQLGALADVDEDWTEKFRLLVGTYQGSNLALAKVKGFLPFRFGLRKVGPLAVASVWPDALAEAIANARRPTLFFVYLLAPHGPYLYRADGSIRPFREWEDDLDYQRLNPAEYGERYSRYAAQIGFVQRQLRALLATLAERELLDPMTVVVHGDHGSRIRRSDLPNTDLSAQFPPDLYDYTGTPTVQDLLDRFSVLLAVKQPGGRGFSTDGRKGSLLRFLSEDLYRESPARLGPGIDSVFLFDGGKNAREIRLRDLWSI